MDLGKTLVEIATFLEANNYRYALIGGLALAAYGHPRSTLDIDFVVEIADQDSIVDFMGSLGYATLHRSPGYSNHRHQDPQLGSVEFVYVRADTAAKLFGAVTHFKGAGDEKRSSSAVSGTGRYRHSHGETGGRFGSCSTLL